MAQLDFNAYEVEPAGDFELLPEGKYTATITASDRKPNSRGTGEILVLDFTIVDGAYKGRRVWARLNIVHQTPAAQEIALGQLSAICRAVGIMTPRDSSELHHRPLSIYVKCVQRADGKGLANEISRYEALDGGAPASGAPGSSTPPATDAAAKSATPPWAS